MSEKPPKTTLEEALAVAADEKMAAAYSRWRLQRRQWEASLREPQSASKKPVIPNTPKEKPTT